jgi:chromate transport protein ChrA
MAVVLVRGTGDVGSAVAALLSRAGHGVVLHDVSAPTHTRRGMSFADALYHGTAELEGLLAKRAPSLRDLPRMLRCRRALPVVDSPLEEVIARARPQVMVDARMRKHERPELQRGLTPLTIGLGPNFEAGANVDVAIETAWGDCLGAVITSGQTRPLSGEPMAIAGHARDRYVYAPLAGVFATRFTIGDRVLQGQEVGRVGGIAIRAPLDGCLRGITHDGASVIEGTKILEVDPRGLPGASHGVGDRPRRIAEGVLQAIDRSTTAAPRVAQIAQVFARYANFTLGGGSATIAVLHRELLQKRGWVDTDAFNLSFALARLTPGTNLLAFCTAIGWLLRGWPGAVAALLAASVPCTLLVVAATGLLEYWQGNPGVAVALQGAVAAAVAITVKTCWTLVHPYFQGHARWRVLWVGGTAFLMYVVLGLSAIEVLLLAAVIGAFLPPAKP